MFTETSRLYIECSRLRNSCSSTFLRKYLERLLFVAFNAPQPRVITEREAANYEILRRAGTLREEKLARAESRLYGLIGGGWGLFSN